MGREFSNVDAAFAGNYGRSDKNAPYKISAKIFQFMFIYLFYTYDGTCI